MADPEEAGAAATDYLRLLGPGRRWAIPSSRPPRSPPPSSPRARTKSGFYKAKIKTAGFFFDRILPQATAAFLAIKSGKRSTMALALEEF